VVIIVFLSYKWNNPIYIGLIRIHHARGNISRPFSMSVVIEKVRKKDNLNTFVVLNQDLSIMAALSSTLSCLVYEKAKTI
jgi:hypothetical protein